jgi:Bacterial TSP3 repeat
MSTTVAFAIRAALFGVLLLTATLLTAAQVSAQDPGYYDECFTCEVGLGGDPPLVAGYPVEPPAGSVEAESVLPVLPSDPTGFEPSASIGDQIEADVTYIGTPDPTSSLVEQINTDVVYLAIDSDFDSLLDGDEIAVYGTDPYNRDSDYDGLPDASEVLGYGTNATNPNASDTDYDGLDDWSELNDHFTDPRSADTDGDGWSDGYEVSIGSNPNVWHLH